MEKNDFSGKNILVMGLGLHGGGVGVIRFLSEAGAKILATDLKTKEELRPSLEKLKDIADIKYVLGQHREADFLQADMIIKNPGVSWKNKFIQLALARKIPVEMDSSLFFKLCKNKIIGVTGTRGKSTTTTLIHNILDAAGKKPIKVGIGQIPVLNKLDELESDSIVVFELSSWRLSALGRCNMSPEIAVFTNIFQDHLNYYSNMDEYLEDKKNIYAYQKSSDICVINWDNEIVKGLEGEVRSKLIRFSCKEIIQPFSAYLKDSFIYWRERDKEERLIGQNEIKIKGLHNVSNILASIAATRSIGVDKEAIRKGVLSFAGLPHRLEWVRELEGVTYYNDTAATSPEGAISGINSFTEPIILIAGGSDKNLAMDGLAQSIMEKTKKVIFLAGKGTDKLVYQLRKKGSYNEALIANSMEEAVKEARGLAVSGEVVLLSPGAASFGMFLNEFDRGDKFKEAVNGLK